MANPAPIRPIITHMAHPPVTPVVRAPRTHPDPGTPRHARTAAILTIALILLVFAAQQIGSAAASRAAPPPDPAAQRAVEPPGQTQELLTTLFVRIFHAMPDPRIAQQLSASMGAAQGDAAAALRAAVVAGEMRLSLTPQAERPGAIEQISNTLREAVKDLPEDAPLRVDAELFKAALAGRPLEPAEQDRLIAHHGVAGRLALVAGLDPEDEQRRAVVGGGGRVLVLLVSLVLLTAAAVLLGLTMLIVRLVHHGRGTWNDRFVPPAPGGSVLLETVAVFVAGFLVLKGLLAILARFVPENALQIVGLCAQWLLLLAALWPLARGVSPKQTARLLGLHPGQGVLKEALCGVAGWIACLPLYVVGALLSTILMALWAWVRKEFMGAPPAPISNPVIEIVGTTRGTLAGVLLVVLATLWAPLAEELIFRGALYRALRERLPVILAAALTALAFGVMHGYPLLMLGPVIGLGLGFSLLREWRDSLIAPMVAHCLHNGSVLAILLLIFSLAS